MSYTGKTGFQQPVTLSAGSNYNANGIMGFNFSKKQIIIGAVILFAIIGIAIYFYYFAKPVTKFHANRENVPTGEDEVKSATIMLFYVDWCPHCKTAKPEWDALKEEYEGKTINGYIVIFEEYNCTDESSEIEELINKYKIDGYPTIKLIKDNQVIEYDAKPTKATMEQFLTTVL
jgi:thiol-disulfide isomerase/thioredoxin